MRLSAPIYRLKRQAKFLARDHDIPLHQALDRIAVAEGFRAWSHLASKSSNPRPAENILAKLDAGDMLLVGARPGHGKTLLGLELAALAAQHGRKGFFFTLDYNEADVLAAFKSIGWDHATLANAVIIDTSDDITADYIIDRLGRAADHAIVVVDYLQLLDQVRSKPDLETQMRTLRNHAKAEGAIVVMISQVDRSFELMGKAMPDVTDVRLPNALDLTLFDKTCFLHNGEIQFETPPSIPVDPVVNVII